MLRVGGFVFDRSAWWYLVDFPIIIFHIVLDGILWCLGVFWLYFGFNRRRGLSAALTLPLPCFPPPWPTDRVKACTEIGTPTCQKFNFANIMIFCCYMDLSMLFYVFLALWQTKPS